MLCWQWNRGGARRPSCSAGAGAGGFCCVLPSTLSAAGVLGPPCGPTLAAAGSVFAAHDHMLPPTWIFARERAARLAQGSLNHCAGSKLRTGRATSAHNTRVPNARVLSIQSNPTYAHRQQRHPYTIYLSSAANAPRPLSRMARSGAGGRGALGGCPLLCFTPNASANASATCPKRSPRSATPWLRPRTCPGGAPPPSRPAPTPRAGRTTAMRPLPGLKMIGETPKSAAARCGERPLFHLQYLQLSACGAPRRRAPRPCLSAAPCPQQPGSRRRAPFVDAEARGMPAAASPRLPASHVPFCRPPRAPTAAR